MPIRADTWIRRMAREHGMIEPFVDEQVRAGVVSFGLLSYGYDIRVADEFTVQFLCAGAHGEYVRIP